MLERDRKEYANMTPYEEDLKNLRDKCPSTENELCEVLNISMLSAEGYYATLVFEWLRNART